MEKRWELTGGGSLTMTADGDRLRFSVQREPDDLGLYKVWLRGQGGGRALLGTLAPEGRQLRLSRCLTVRSLERQGCWPVTGGEAVLAFRFGRGDGWYREEHPEKLLRDGELAKLWDPPVLCNREKENFHLAVPFLGTEPLQAESVATLGRLSYIHGKPFLMWDFTGDGRLKIKNSDSSPSE